MMRPMRRLLSTMPMRARDASIFLAPYLPQLSSNAVATSPAAGSGASAGSARPRMAQQVNRGTPRISHCADTG